MIFTFLRTEVVKFSLEHYKTDYILPAGQCFGTLKVDDNRKMSPRDKRKASYRKLNPSFANKNNSL